MADRPPLSWNIEGFYFDAWLRMNQNTAITITQHPVENGASITDHSYRNPNRFSFDVGMTDVVTSPMFPGSGTRSVNAYNALVELQQTRRLLTLGTKYQSNYTNILIESIDVSDDYRTVNALRATINLVEVIIVKTKYTQVSLTPQATDQTNRGQVSGLSFNQIIRERVTDFIDRIAAPRE